MKLSFIIRNRRGAMMLQKFQILSEMHEGYLVAVIRGK